MKEITVVLYRLEECGDGCCSWSEKDEEIHFTENELEAIWPDFRKFAEDDYIFSDEIPDAFAEKFTVHYYATIYRR